MSTHCQPNGTGKESHSVKVMRSDAKPSVLTHGLQHLRHLPCDDPVRHMTHTMGPAAFISLHGGGGVRSYHPDGGLRATLQSPTEFTGLTGTKLPERIAGWGPGASLALLDSELRPLVYATDPPDIRVCLAAEQSAELVTAGAGNVCVWCLAHLVCKMKVWEGLGQGDVFTQLALAPPTSGRHHRAFAACETAVSLIDLTEGRLLEKRRNLHLREITSLVHCPLLDCLVTASRDMSIRVWGPEGDLLIAFVGHTGLVTALACCPLSGLIISASLDRTLRCWSLEEGDQVQVVLIKGGPPPLALGGPGTGGTFFSFSEWGVDFWNMTSLYSLHCKLGVAGGGPMQQITTPPCPPPYPPRVLCVSGAGNLALVDAETGAILTAFGLGAGRKVKSADYCMHKETLLVLTEEGAVLRASALTNPASGLDEWLGKWQEPWPKAKQTEGEGDSPPSSPGPASCLVLYSAVTDPTQALEDWRHLQELCGQGAIKRRSLHDAKNWFLVMLGQEGGCVSALKWDSGEVLCRAPAHNGQNVTALLADPENSYLFSTGEDRMVLVWKVCPFTPECLSLCLSFSCEQAPVHLASLAPQLALAFQEPDSATYSLVHLCLETQSRTDHPPSQDHLDSITGLCVCPEMGVLASSSRDGTIRIWDDENRLLRTLQLNAEPECLAYCGQRGGLLLGIRGNLYRIPITHLLSQDLHIQLLCAKQFDPILDLPITQARTEANTHRFVSSVEEEKQCSRAEKASDTDYAALVMRSRDLETLQQRAVESRKKKPSNARRTKKEAFARYLKLVYRDPLKIELPVEDTFDLQGALFSPRGVTELLSLATLTVREQAFHSQSQARFLEQGAEVEQEEGSSSVKRTPWGHVPNSVLLEQLWPEMVVENTVPRKPWALREGLGLLGENNGGEVKFLVSDGDDDEEDDDDDELNVRHLLEKQDARPRLTTPLLPLSPPPLTMERVRPRLTAPRRPLIVRHRRPEPPPTPIPKPRTASPPRTSPYHPPPPKTLPCQCPLPHSPPHQLPPAHSPPREVPPSLTPPRLLPDFLGQFVEQDWFQEIFPDHCLLHWSLCPEEFALLLLQHLRRCHVGRRTQILNALLVLLRQGALKNSEQIGAGLIDLLRFCAKSNMSAEEKRFVRELLKALASLAPDSTGTMVELLTVLAHRELGLQNAVLGLLKAMGVEEAEPWLSTEVASWRDRPRGEPDTWAHLREVADHWLDFWTCKHKARALFLRGAERKEPLTPVDTLRFFCSVQRENQSRPPPPPPEGRKDTVLLQQHRPKPVQRLGETHSLARTRQTRGVTLPPLPHRPQLEGFVPFISLSLPRVSLCPFPCPGDQPYQKGVPRRYFFPEHSYAQSHR